MMPTILECISCVLMTIGAFCGLGALACKAAAEEEERKNGKR